MVFLYVWERIWPRLLCACDFIKGVCFHGMAEKQKKLKRKAHNLPIIAIMCQNIEEWFKWQSPCMTICCFMASQRRDKYNFFWKRHKIAKSWWPNAAEWRIWFISQFFHPWEHYKINRTKISSETWTNFAVAEVQTSGGDSAAAMRQEAAAPPAASFQFDDDNDLFMEATGAEQRLGDWQRCFLTVWRVSELSADAARPAKSSSLLPPPESIEPGWRISALPVVGALPSPRCRGSIDASWTLKWWRESESL